MLAGARVLVSGGAGFLGRRVVAGLQERGAVPVVVRSGRPLPPGHTRADDLTVAEDTADLTRQDEVEAVVARVRPDVVVHLAAEVGGIGANRAHPGRYFYANAAMGLHLIEAARLAGVRKFVQAGTVCAYPKHTPVPFAEDALWDGYPEETNAPYGVAKKSLLVMLQAYREQYGLDGIFLLPVNLYGPEDNFDLDTSHVIPALVRKLVAARDRGAPTVEAWGTGAASREFLYVDDAARGILLATERYDDPEPVNLGAGSEIRIRDLVALIRRLVGYEGEVVWDPTKPDGQPRRMLDTRRARERFGFQAEVGFEDGLRRTIAWWESAGAAVATGAVPRP